jgi:hypothetical protein
MDMEVFTLDLAGLGPRTYGIETTPRPPDPCEYKLEEKMKHK